MKRYSFEVPIDFAQAHLMFNDPRVLDAVHGRGLWDFDAWKLSEDQSVYGQETFVRQGRVRGVEIPVFVRFLNKGKRHIKCRISQEYTSDPRCIRISSTMQPLVLRSDLAMNRSVIRVHALETGKSLIECESTNSTSLPHPLAQAAIDCMDDMTSESMDFLYDALR